MKISMKPLSKKQIAATQAYRLELEAQDKANEEALKAVIPAVEWDKFKSALYDHGCGGGHLGARDILLRELGMVKFTVYSLAAGLDPDSFHI